MKINLKPIKLPITLMLIVLGSLFKVNAQNNPSAISGLSVWLRADSNVTLSGSNVITWLDISGNNYIFSQPTGSKQPMITSVNTQLNNHPSIFFDGVDDVLPTTSFVTLGNQGSSIYVVANTHSQTNWGMFVCYGKATAGDWNLRLRPTTPNLSFINANNNTGAGLSNPLPTDLVTSDFTILGGTIDAPSDVWKITENGVLKDSVISVYSQNDSNLIYIASRDNQLYSHSDISEVIVFNKVLSTNEHDSIILYLRDRYAPPVNIGSDMVINGFCDTLLYAGSRFSSYLWSTGDASDTITISQSGTYWVNTTDVFGFITSDTVNITYPDVFSAPFVDTTLCYGDTLEMYSQLDTTDYNFLWSNSSTDSLIKITNPGQYWVVITGPLGCSINSDTISINVDSLSNQASLGPDKTVCNGSSIELVSGNSSALNYLWSTGDTTAQILIDSADTYFIQVSNSNGCLANDTIIIDTSGIAPTVSFTTQNECTNSLALFTNTSVTTDGSNIIGVYWNFGDGDTSTIQNPSHQYASDSSYQVSLEITTDSGCVNTLISAVQVHSPPTSGFFATTNPICSGQTTNFSDNSFSTDGTINSWMWDFGDTGTTDTSSLQNPSYQFPVTNIYNVQIIVTTQYGCSDTTINPITVKQSPVASFTLVDSCLNSITQFTNTSQGNIFSSNWDFGDANTSTLINPSNTYANSGVYNVTLITTEINGCIDSTIVPITIYENPIANYTTQDFCALSSNQLYDSSSTVDGTIVTWDWNVVNHSNQSSNQHPIFSFATIDTGYYFLDLIITTDIGCKDSIRDSINVFPLPVPDFTFNPTIGGPPLLVNFNNISTGGNSYNWSFGDDSTSTLTSPSHIYVNTNTYAINLVVTSIYGCTDSTTKSILVIDPVTDIAVTNVTYDFISNAKFLTISAQLSNFGTLVIISSDIEAEISEKGAIMESWVGALSGGAQTGFQFSSSFEVNGEIPDVICVRALNPNGQNDDVPSNNEFCIVINKFQLINISPNPTSDDVNLTYIIPAIGNVNINLYNSTGKKITELFSGNLEKGLIRQTFNLSTYSAGIYIIEIEYQGSSFKEKIVLK